jgi:uncharacterized damage-inducible protein DinB
MNIEDIQLIYDYNYWANGRLLAASAGVTPEQFVAKADFPFGGLRGTLVHILDAEYGWRMFLQKNDWSTPEPEEAEFPSLAALQKRWKQEEQEMRAYLATLGDEDMNVHRRYTTDEGVERDRILWHCLWHVVNHGTQHRSEAAALLTQYQHSPGNIDFTVFLSDTKRS